MSTELEKHNEEAAEIIVQLIKQNTRLRHALEKIRDEDYRGNQHSSHFIAKKVLEEIE